MHNFNKNLQTLYSKLVTNNVSDSKSYNERQCILSYSALLKVSSDDLADCKFQSHNELVRPPLISQTQMHQKV